LLRIAGGALLLVLVVWYADPGALWSKLSRADLRLVVLAVVLSAVANSLSALRWAVIARGLGLAAPSGKLVIIYARGITTNMLLPGATLSGDLLRSVQLSRLGNPFVACALSVFLDRFSGLWVLCILSLLAASGITLWGALGHGAHIAPNQMSAYLLILAGIAAVPFIPLPFGRLERSNVAWISTLTSRWERLRGRLRQARPALLASVWHSLGVQILSACTLWICGLALGVSLSYPAMLAAAAPIFIMAALPIGVEIHPVSDQPAVVKRSVSEFTHSLAEAVAIVLAVSFVSLGLRTGVVVALSIPLVLAMTLLAMYLFGIELQRI
jgi:uncharacterized membrane protein YbhN (UPF0104 family)